MATNESKRTGSIRFLPVSARPCEAIPGGTVLGKMVCPSFDEPIGWIVRSPAETTDGSETATSAGLWHFVPTCGIDPTLRDYSDQGSLQTAVRRQYRGIYDRMPYERTRLIAKGDDCEIGSMILEWCGLVDLWDDNELDSDYSVIRDLLIFCSSADYRKRVSEDGGPGLSGVWYRVYTASPSLFVREARKLAGLLLEEKRAKTPPPPKIRLSRKRKEGSHPTPR